MKKAFLAAIACLLFVHGFSQLDSSATISGATDVSLKITKPDALLYPNPARNKVSLQVNGFDPGMVSVKIIDLNGNLLKEENRLLIYGDDEEIVLFFFLPAGIYFVTMQEKQKWVRKKMIVE